MDTIQGLLIAIGWFLLRFGLPVLATIAVCWLFKRLDARWQAEGEAYREQTGLEKVVPAVRCWVFNDCPEDRRAGCPAYQDQSIPCWQHFRSKNGALKETCLGCRVFRDAPVPAGGD